MRNLARSIKNQVRRGANRGTKAAAIFLTARVRETMSVPAPKVRTKSGGWRVVTPATVGAPIRLVTGQVRRALSWVELGTVLKKYYITCPVRSMKGFPYPTYHEVRQAGMPGSGRHQFVAPTAHKYRNEIKTIIGSNVRKVFSYAARKAIY